MRSNRFELQWHGRVGNKAGGRTRQTIAAAPMTRPEDLTVKPRKQNWPESSAITLTRGRLLPNGSHIRFGFLARIGQSRYPPGFSRIRKQMVHAVALLSREMADVA